MLIKKFLSKENLIELWNKLPFKSHILVAIFFFGWGYVAADCFIV